MRRCHRSGLIKMADCEDGELLDSDEELKKKIVSNTNFSYRNGNLASDSSKSDSNSSDDEIDLKKKKHYHRVATIPIPNNNFATKFKKAAEQFQNCQNLSKKVNNVWGSVLEEQSLTQDLSKFDVQEALKNDERGSESYHYLFNSKVENGQDNIDFQMDLSQRHGTKRNIKDRIGKRSYDKNKIRDILVTESDPLEKVVAELANKLQEPKTELLERVVQTLGITKALELYFMTEDVEEAGGMMIMDGSRRRTPGGVFFQLLKSDSHMTKEQRNAIFIDEKHMINQRRKARIKRKNKCRPNTFQGMLKEAKKEQAKRERRKARLESKENDLRAMEEIKTEEEKDDERMNEKNDISDSITEDEGEISEEENDNVLIVEIEKDDKNLFEEIDIGMSDLDGCL